MAPSQRKDRPWCGVGVDFFSLWRVHYSRGRHRGVQEPRGHKKGYADAGAFVVVVKDRVSVSRRKKLPMCILFGLPK